MNINQIKNIYLANGLDEFKIRSHSDINSVHGVKVSEISGYSTLLFEHKMLFDEFIIHFYNAQGLESRSEFLPLSINYVLSEEFLGKHEDTDDYFVPLGGKITAIHINGDTKVLSTWKDKKFKTIPCSYTEKQNYLRFEYKNGKSKEWQYVISATKWY
ncbi:hypothetical protein [Ruminiclostridium cellobioparum]|uniref:Uncharacterized protein n=1 Tax=Ruminiclostridium cellobioparum subsp. termitidis CT1112 TaxID=1195236 RepID=S0FPX8_RUMCE|nr:hypothetical protein [Ruminiclostridium cellobioparum]EMS72386.1 hypothetical protein CTER_1711 [Ruminiclostridium cellobioparum subsp. termitidis CT1112]